MPKKSAKRNTAEEKEETALAIPGQSGVPGVPDLDPDELQLPFIRINHDTGEFENNMSGEASEKLECLPIAAVRQRVFWEPDSEPTEGSQPLCRSFDGRRANPEGDVDGAEVDTDEDGFYLCKTCENALWGEGGEKPLCAKVWVMLITVGGVPCIIQFQRTAEKAARAYLNAFYQSGKPLYTKWCVMTLQEKKYGSGKGSRSYYVPILKAGESATEEELAEIQDNFSTLASMLQRAQLRQDEVAEEAGDVDEF